MLHTKFSKYCGKALGWYFVHWPFKKLEASTFTTLSPPLASWVKAEEPDSDDDVGAKDLYDEPVHMREIGDRDGFGKFCIGIDGVDVTDGGPTTKDQIHEIVREAIMESGGDEWTTQDFYDAYPETNVAKVNTYRRVEYPLEGKFRIIPTNGATFHYGRFNFGGATYMRDYIAWLSGYEMTVSRALNTGLRHHAGKISSHNQAFALKCDDAGWIDIVEVLSYPLPILLDAEPHPRSSFIALNESERRQGHEHGA